ncbi:hypothetical protein AA309_27675 [Microvirga vignae]|uniref:HTH tetR-type domain-containing protein n=1 Tax=Microvirga vignae TaxID=1225564 RepID=A0A0H1R4M9_9HYPH|nr:TetR/AcrR family transcriptional regulator [Microvirga vignae]KLK90088.1 hypothetical protein AA309_27675 [Microvirga vignae]
MSDQELLRKAAAGGQDDEAARRLGRSDWLATAVQIFLSEGIEAVRITRLADALSVTRGSFYWHFKDRDDLLDGLIAFWSQKNTAAILSAIEGAGTLLDGILAIFDAWIDPGRFDPRLDQAMRDWARRSDAVRSAVAEADDIRVRAIEALFARFGYGSPEAFIRARIFYFTQIGYYALSLEEPLAQRLSYLEAYYETFTGVPMDSEAAAAYRSKHLGSPDP